MNFTVETDFPGGNACDVELETRSEQTRLAFAPDPRKGPETLWFYLRICRVSKSDSEFIELELKHSYNMLGGHLPQNLRPVIRFAEQDWERLPAPTIEEFPDGRVRVLWTIAAPRTSAEIAVCFPYGQNELEALLHETGDVWKRDTIGVGQRATPLMRLSNDYGQLENKRRGLYLLARQHAGETPGSWALDGFLRRLAALGERAPLAWAVPLADADSVHFGDYSKDRFPYDLNRAWGQPPMRHESLVIQRDITRWSQRCKPFFALDFHAPGACDVSGVYCYAPTGEGIPAPSPLLRISLERMREHLTPRFASADFERTANYRSRWETSNFAQFMAQKYEIPSVSLEIPYALCGENVLTREDYREIGARIADAVCEL